MGRQYPNRVRLNLQLVSLSTEIRKIGLELKQQYLIRGTLSALQAEIEHKDSPIGALEARVADLELQLDNEQRSRFADEVNAVDDYENLRTQVIRQLSGQVNLLNDGLHALRNGSIAVADEFVDRALTKIDAEVKRLFFDQFIKAAERLKNHQRDLPSMFGF